VISEIIDWIFGKHVRNKLHVSYFYGRALAESNAHTHKNDMALKFHFKILNEWSSGIVYPYMRWPLAITEDMERFGEALAWRHRK
jgi:hypothetical protein